MAFGWLADFAADSPVVAPDLELAIELVGPVQPSQLGQIQWSRIGVALGWLALGWLALVGLALIGRSHRKGGSNRRLSVS